MIIALCAIYLETRVRNKGTMCHREQGVSIKLVNTYPFLMITETKTIHLVQAVIRKGTRKKERVQKY